CAQPRVPPSVHPTEVASDGAGDHRREHAQHERGDGDDGDDADGALAHQYPNRAVSGTSGSTSRPRRAGSSISTRAPATWASARSNRRTAAPRVPPVASTSSTMCTRLPAVTASVWISPTASPYSSE